MAHLRFRKSHPEIVSHIARKTVLSVLVISDAYRSSAKKQSLWEPTRHQNLFRYVPSEIIFARLKISGKQVRKSLKTQNLELAKSKLAELERDKRAVADDRKRGMMLFGDALGFDDFSPHSTRHHFISECVMASVDYLTIARWVGHKDGGVPNGKIHGRLNNAHLKEQAAKLR